MDRPTLTTPRLLLRPFVLTDARDAQRLAGAREIADGTLTIPHPYPDGLAEEWIELQQRLFESRELINFAIALRTGEVVGSIGLRMKKHGKAEIGYWIGVAHWGHGYATEAAAAVIDYGFRELNLNRIEAAHFSGNPASGRVMIKNGMKHEGTARQAAKKWDEYRDLEWYSILRSEWLAAKQTDEIGAAPVP